MTSSPRKSKKKVSKSGPGINARIGKEIGVIFLMFALVLMLVSFLSFHPADPSIHHSVPTRFQVHNQFGLIGAHLAGFFLGLFGLGAFWIPMLILIAGGQLLKGRFPHMIGFVIAGGLLLIVSTGCLLSIFSEYYTLHGVRYPAGGLIGMALKCFFIGYANFTGSVIILLVLLMTGFILATGLSPSKIITAGIRLGVPAGRQLYAYGRRMANALRNRMAAIHQGIRRKPVCGFLPTESAKALVQAVTPQQLPVPPNQDNSDQIRAPQRAEALPIIDPPINIKAAAPRPVSCPDASPTVPGLEKLKTIVAEKGFQLPPLSFLNEPSAEAESVSVNRENLRLQSGLLEGKLEDFGIKGKVVEISPGPVITTFEYKPAPGVKISKIVNLTDDLALALSAISIRIVAPIPGKDVIGIEIPNAVRELVSIREIVAAKVFATSKFKLTLCLGKDIIGNPVIAPLEKMPHLLIAGATGTGKSVGLNAMITSLLYKCTPEEVKLLMVDPKRIELSLYDGIPHLISPVVTDMKKATNALFWAVKEMERRYEALAEKKVRNISQYNEKVEKENKRSEDEPEPIFPYIVIIIDELADLMMVASRDVEVALTRLAQMARAAGIHMILATQRPSVDVLTGVIKANFPTRMSFQVSSKIDSRTIIDANGAENLLGNGDMLFVPPGTAKLQRIHGAYISEDELSLITEFLKAQQTPEYIEDVTTVNADKENAEREAEERDDRYDEAVALVTKTRQASISMVQRHLRIGYNRAARIIEMMEQEGIVGPSDGVKAREVLVKSYDDIP